MPKFPDILLNNNPDAPSVDLNDLQVKGVGIFADATERDALNSNLHTEGYLAIMKDTDTPFIYTGGTWTDAANWKEVKGVWEEVPGTTTDITYQEGRVGIKDSASVYPGHTTISSLFGPDFPSSTGRGTNTLLHLHEGQVTFSTASTSWVSFLEMSNPTHSSAVGGAIGTSGYNMRIHGYHALEFTHGTNSASPQMMVTMDIPTTSSVGSIGVGRVNSALGGINLPSFGPGSVDTTNYSLSIGGRIIFKNHSNISWDAITQGPGGYQAAGVSLSSFNSHDILVAVSSDSTTPGSYGYVGINSYSPSAGGPAFEVSDGYGKFNDGLHIGDITTTGYAFPTATGTLDQVLKVDANGDLVFGGASAGGGATDLDSLTDVTITGTPGNGELLIAETSGTYVNTTLTASADGFLRITNASGQVTLGAGQGTEVQYTIQGTAVSVAGEVEGNVLTFGTTTGMTAGAVYVWNGTDWVVTRANAESTTKGLMGVALGTAATDGLLTHGVAYLNHNPGTAGDVLYVNDGGNGQLTSTQPILQNSIVRVAGYCLANNKVFFSPSQDWIELA